MYIYSMDFRMSFFVKFLIIALKCVIIAAINTSVGDANLQQVNDGSAKFNSILKHSQLPKYGQCWKDALTSLESGCEQLTDEVQHRLALRFANCFLLTSGRQDYPCHHTQEISDCTKDMTTEGYLTYTEYFTHTQNMCFFLKSQVWQEQTDKTIVRLAETSQEVVESIEYSNKIQSEVIHKQGESLRNQQLFLDRGHELKMLLQHSSGDVHKLLTEFKESTNEQKDVMFEVFDKLSVLQSIVVGEFTGFYSFLFYTLSIMISYLLTSTPRTSGSRFWLFVIMTGNIVFERIVIFSVSQRQQTSDGTLNESTLIYTRLWLCRKMFTSVAISTWFYFACTFTDLNKINNQLLEQIRKQNSDLKRLLQGSSKDVGPKDEKSQHGITHPERKRQLPVNPKNHRTSLNSSTGYESDSDYTSECDSEASDRTYIFPGDVSVAESCTSFMTSSSFASRISRESTHVSRWSPDSTFSLREELRDIRQATPLREMTPIPGVTEVDLSIASWRDSSVLNSTREILNSSSTSSTRRGPGRPCGSGRRSAPVQPTQTPINQYNLRSRKRSMAVTKDAHHNKSSNDIAAAVKQLSNVAARNTTKVNATIDRESGPQPFSDDDKN